jgi:cellobiose phosphorylase
MLETKIKSKKKATAEELLAKIQPVVNSAVSFCKFTEEQKYRLVKYEKINHEGNAGAAIELTDEDADTYDITIFPIGPDAFEGEVRHKGQTYTTVIAKSNDLNPENNNTVKMNNEGC